MRSGRDSGPSHGRSKPGMRRFDTEKPHEPGLRLRPAPGRPLVADLAARPGGRARERGDGRRVVVRLHLHQRVGEVLLVAVAAGLGIGEEAADARRPPSPPRCPSRPTPCPAGSPRAIVRIMPKSESACGSPSITHDALKILCRQCSELACANIVSSTSVGLRPAPAEVVDEVVDLVGAPGRGRSGALASTIASRAAAEDVHLGQRLRGDVAEQLRRPPRGEPSTVSVIRSCRTGRTSARSPSPSRWNTVPRSMRRTKSRPQWRAMSVAFDDQGEIVPGPRRDEDVAPAAGQGHRWGVGLRARPPVRHEALEDRPLRGRGVARGFHEVPVGGEGHAKTAAALFDLPVQLVEAEGRERGTPTKREDLLHA